MPSYYSEGNLNVRTPSYEKKKEKVSGNNTKNPEKFKEE